MGSSRLLFRLLSCRPLRARPPPALTARRSLQASASTAGLWSKMSSYFAGLIGPDEVEGRLVGTDEKGNRYFEVEPDEGSAVPHRAAKTRRYFLVPGQKTVEDSWMRLNIELPCLPSEWDAWLRHRRADPPTPEEIAGNAAAARMRALKGREIEEKFMEELRAKAVEKGESSLPTAPKTKNGAFPQHPGLEVSPGEDR